MATVAVEPDFEATLFLASADCFDVVDVGGTVVLQKNKKNYKFDLGFNTLMPVYHCHKTVFRPKMAIFQRAGMREGELPLPLAFQYLIFMI